MCFKCDSNVVQACVYVCLSVYKVCFKCVSSILPSGFQARFRWVSGVFPVCFKCVLSVCFKCVSSVSQVCFKFVSVCV